jgi:2-oxoglutarate dehydrogenase E2 component (dihydrolipoamide succinyltransferase)
MSNIVVPELGESVVEARVARWLKKEGDRVEVGEPIVELETEKIDLEVNAERGGVIASIKRKEGEDVKIGEVLGVVDESPTAPAAAPAKATESGGNGASAASAAPPAPLAPPAPPAPLAPTSRRIIRTASVAGNSDANRYVSRRTSKPAPSTIARMRPVV